MISLLNYSFDGLKYDPNMSKDEKKDFGLAFWVGIPRFATVLKKSKQDDIRKRIELRGSIVYWEMKLMNGPDTVTRVMMPLIRIDGHCADFQCRNLDSGRNVEQMLSEANGIIRDYERGRPVNQKIFIDSVMGTSPYLIVLTDKEKRLCSNLFCYSITTGRWEVVA